MNVTPQLQVAMDYISLPKALVMTALVAPEVDIIEIGTPLCKAAGLNAIRAIREICPDKLILADFKTPDVGGLEAAMAFDAGADMMTVIGGAALATVEQALAVARERGKEMLMELTGVRDNEILNRATEWRQIGIDRLVYHREWDAQSAGRMWAESDKVTIRKLIDMGFRVTVTGGMTMELLPFFSDLPVSVLICGRGIREAADPRAAARQMRQALNELWSGTSQAGSLAAKSLSELAVKAVRWGVSDMGLSLVVDGRNCPGCDYPDRFCLGTQTEILCPSNLRAVDVVQGLGQILTAGGSFGLVNEGAFFLDPTQLSDLSRNRVIDLLNATGTAIQNLGYPVDINAGIKTANQVLGIS
jgi:3-dehydro-L-gulonate-6-phosphate decarboxylase